VTNATVAEHEAACVAFCEKYRTQCGVSCPETCDGHANSHAEGCSALGVNFFQCLSNQDPSAYDCDAGYMLIISQDACETEADDMMVCRELDGVACERDTDSDQERCASKAGTPYAFYCVSSAVPEGCVSGSLAGRYYCCPTE
jgi:hypothetical protein